MDPQNFTVLNPVIANRQTPVETATVFREPTVTLTVTPSQTPTLTPTSTPTPVPSSTQTSSPTPTATWINQKAGEVTAPILLYHHIASIENPSLYYISPETFKSQMEALKSWGYTSITIMQLIKVMLTGGELPVRPIVISFDDGDEDVYENAFPIMQQLGLTGTFFPIVEAIDQKGTVTHDQLKKMADSGWEIGSHSMTHPDLRDPKFGIRWEIYDSNAELEKIIGRPVEIFATLSESPILLL